MKKISRLRFSLLAFVFGFSGFVFAHQNYVENNLEEIQPQQTIPSNGENFNTRTGQLSFEIPIVKIPGLPGLDLEIGISFNKTSAMHGGVFGGIIYCPSCTTGIYASRRYPVGNLGAGTWGLEIPRLVASRWNDVYCGNPHGGPMLVLPGKSPIQFVQNGGSSPFPGMNYVSKEKWTARCHHNPITKMYVGNMANWVVRSPKGMVYQFYIQPDFRNNESEDLALPGVFNINRIEDLHGNWIQFNYEKLGSRGYIYDPQQYAVRWRWALTSIVRHDGQRINLGYRFYDLTQFGWYRNYTWNDGIDNTFHDLATISANGKTWTFDHSICNPTNLTAGCYDENRGLPKVEGFLASLLRTITRPDGKQWRFRYGGYQAQQAGITDGGMGTATPFPGIHFHVSQIDHPNGLIANYVYLPIHSGYLNGQRPTMKLADRRRPPQPYLSLLDKTYRGPSMGNSYHYTYRFFVPNWESGQAISGDPVSYSFLLEPERLIVQKFSRDRHAGDWGIAYNPAVFDSYQLLEQGTFANPKGVDIDGLPPIPPPPPPPPVPSPVSMKDLSPDYPAGTSFVINFNIGGQSPIVWAGCAINRDPMVACTSFNSFRVPGNLPEGTHTLTVQVKNLFGLLQNATLQFRVGTPKKKTVPDLANDLNRLSPQASETKWTFHQE